MDGTNTFTPHVDSDITLAKQVLVADESTPDEMKKLFVYFHQLEKQQKSVNNEFLTKLSEINTKYDELHERQSQLEYENEYLRDEILVLKAGLSEVQQNSLVNNVIIRGVPEIESDNSQLFSLLDTVFKSIGASFNKDALTDFKRLGKKSTNSKIYRPILVKFADLQLKKVLMDAKKAKNNLACDSVIFNNKPIGSENQKIYIDEQLTKLNQQLYSEARQLKKSGLVKFAWTNDGRVLVREKEKAPVVKLNREGDVHSLRESLASNSGSGNRFDGRGNTATNNGSGKRKASPHSRQLRSNNNKQAKNA